MIRGFHPIVLAVVLAIFVAPARAEDARVADHLKLSATLDYSTGDYDTRARTGIWYIPFEAEYTRDRLVAKLTVPFLSISNTNPGLIVPPPGGPQPGPVPRRRRAVTSSNSGIGDILLSAGYKVVRDDATGWYVTPSAIVKFGTADPDRALGTGENDLSLQCDVAKVIDRWTAYGNLGYTFVGDPPGTSLDDVLYGRIGTEYAWEEKSAGVHFDWKHAATLGISGEAEATAYLNGPLSPELAYTVFLRKGFTSSVADFGIGAGLTYNAF